MNLRRDHSYTEPVSPTPSPTPVARHPCSAASAVLAWGLPLGHATRVTPRLAPLVRVALAHDPSLAVAASGSQEQLGTWPLARSVPPHRNPPSVHVSAPSTTTRHRGSQEQLGTLWCCVWDERVVLPAEPPSWRGASGPRMPVAHWPRVIWCARQRRRWGRWSGVEWWWWWWWGVGLLSPAAQRRARQRGEGQEEVYKCISV